MELLLAGPAAQLGELVVAAVQDEVADVALLEEVDDLEDTARTVTSTPWNLLSTFFFHRLSPSRMVPFWWVRKVVSCSIHFLHWPVSTPTLFPEDTAV